MDSGETEPIDVVIAWVDGNDPAHKQKVQPFLDSSSSITDDIAGPTRFRSVGEIYYCIASIFRFAPFVRKIFIITDNQNPNLNEFIQHNFPGSNIELEIVDHRIVFRGYEYYLPVFSSMAIETCTFRIPGLSENYVYFNDDFFLVRPLQYSDWFRNGKIVAYGHWRNMPLDRLLSLIKPRKNGHKPIGFKDTMISAALKLGYKWKYFHIEHLPHPIKKSVFSSYFSENHDHFLENISYRFRSEGQFNPQESYYLLMFETGKAIQESTKDKLLYLKPVNRGPNYVTRKIKVFEKNPLIKFCCIGSLDLANELDTNELFEWLQKLLNIEIEISDKSS
jgi:hypothetical protein